MDSSKEITLTNKINYNSNKILKTLCKKPKEKQDNRLSNYPSQQERKEGTNPKSSPLQVVN
jgi:hypothetical protein